MTIVNMVGGGGGLDKIFSTIPFIEFSKVVTVSGSSSTVPLNTVTSYPKVIYSTDGTTETIPPQYNQSNFSGYRSSLSSSSQVKSVDFVDRSEFVLQIRDILSTLGQTSVSFNCTGMVGWIYLLNSNPNYKGNLFFSHLTSGFPTYTATITVTQDTASISIPNISITHVAGGWSGSEMRLVMLPTSITDVSFT